MNVLAFDTCLGCVSVAFRHRTADSWWSTASASEQRQAGQAERLMPMIAEVLESAGADFARVQRVAVTLGPGTFTGVRTGIAAARAFRLAAGVEVVGVTSLAVIAHRAYDEELRSRAAGRPVLVALDARRGHVYAQLFGASALDPISQPVEVTPDAALGLGHGSAPFVMGSGAGLVAEAAERRGSHIVLGPISVEPDARHLAELAAGLVPLDDVLPIYLRPPDAKPQTGKSLARAP